MNADGPPHGTPARYDHGTRTEPPCRDACCGDAKRRARKRADLARITGRGGLVDAGPAREHIAALHARGDVTIARLARLADVTPGTVRRLLGRDAGFPPTGRVDRAVARRLLAVRTERSPAPTDHDTVAATGTARRLRALVVAGRPLNVIAAELGTSRSQVAAIVHGDRTMVRVSTARDVRALSDRWYDTPPPQASTAERDRVKGAQRLAARHGWVPLACWDDLEDPRERPRGMARSRAVSPDAQLRPDPVGPPRPLPVPHRAKPSGAAQRRRRAARAD